MVGQTQREPNLHDQREWTNLCFETATIRKLALLPHRD